MTLDRSALVISSTDAVLSPPAVGSAHAELRSLGRPALAVPTFSERGGGVAYVSRLLRAALSDEQLRRPRDYELTASATHTIPTRQRVQFGMRLLKDAALRRSDWIVFSHMGISEAQRWIPRGVRLPFAVQLHGSEAWEDPVPAVVRQARLRLAPSRFTARRCVDAHPELHPIHVCPHGLLPGEAPALGNPDHALLANVRECSALIVGRLLSSERRKGHDQLLECWPTVRARLPDAQLIVAGEGDDLPRLREKAIDLGIEHAVTFTGFVSVDTLEALFRRVGVMAMPSRQEGFGIVYLEAMRAGLACIGATEDGASEPILPGVTGLLVEQSDRRELSNSLIAVLGDANLRARLGAAGQRRYEDEFTFERYKERLLATLHEHFSASDERR